MNKKYLLTIAGLSLAQLALSLNAKAQETKSLNDVVVTATKNDQKQSQTGKVTTIIGRDVLDRSHGKSLTDLLSEQAGLIIGGSTNNPGSNKSLFLRGAGSAYAIVLIDGIPQNDPSGVGGVFDLRLISIDQIDRIEILKGGQSTIYGSDAVAGVINIITKKGGAAGNTVYGVFSAGSNQSFKETIGLNGNVSAFDYNINYTHDKTDGINEAAVPVGKTGNFDKDGYKADQLNANFGIKLDQHLSINPFVRYSFGNYNFDGGAFVDANNYSILKNLSIGTNAKYQFNTGKINLNYSFQKSSNDAHTAYPSYSEGKIHLLDLYYDQKITDKLNLLVGIDNRDMQLSSGVNKPKTNIFAAYGSLFLHNLSVFNLEVGGRYNKHEQYGDNYTYSVTPSINIIKEVKLYGTVSTAFKIPGLSMLFGQYGANLNLKPEKSKNYEAGVNFNFADEKFTLRVTGYKRDLTDAIIYAYPAGYINQLSQKTKGFEIEPAVKLGKFSLNGYYAYVEGNEFNYVDNAVADYLFRRPKHTFGINAGVQATENLYVSANYRYFGNRTDGDFTAYKVETLPAYKLLNAYAEYALAKKRVKIFFDAKNILNEKYNEFIGYNTLGFNFNAGVSFNIH